VTFDHAFIAAMQSSRRPVVTAIYPARDLPSLPLEVQHEAKVDQAKPRIRASFVAVSPLTWDRLPSRMVERVPECRPRQRPVGTVSDFDPYYKWLGIPPDEQPPNHYRLLGIPLFTDDADVIANAADQRMLHLRSFQTGPRAALSQKLLNEIAQANACLLRAETKSTYDAALQEELASQLTLLPPAKPPVPQAEPASADRQPQPVPDALTEDSPSQPSEVESAIAVEPAPVVHAAKVVTHAHPTHRRPRRVSPWLIAAFAVGPAAVMIVGYVLLGLIVPELDFLGLFHGRADDSVASKKSAGDASESSVAAARDSAKSPPGNSKGQAAPNANSPTRDGSNSTGAGGEVESGRSDSPDSTTPENSRSGSPLRAVAFSHEGDLVVTGGDDKIVRIWKRDGDKPLSSLQGHKGAILCMATQPAGELLAAGSYDGTIIVWNLSQRKEVRTIRCEEPVRCLAFAPDGNTLAAGCGRDGGAGQVTLWSVEEGRSIGKIEGHSHAVRSVAYSPDGALLASISGWPADNRAPVESQVIVWDCQRDTVAYSTHSFSQGVTSVAFSQDGNTLAVTGAGLTPTGQRVFATQLYDSYAGVPMQQLLGGANATVAVHFFDNDRKLVVVDERGGLHVWDLKQGAHLATLSGSEGAIAAAGIAPDRSELATVDDAGTFRTWPLRRDEWQSEASGSLVPNVDFGQTYRVRFTNDGRALLVTSFDSGCAVRRAAGHFETPEVIDVGADLSCFWADMSRDGRTMAAGFWDRGTSAALLLVIDTATGKATTLRGHDSRVVRGRYSPDGTMLATGGANGEIALWNAEIYKRHDWGRLREHRVPITGLEISPNGKMLATAADDRTFKIWDLPEDRILQAKPLASRFTVNNLAEPALCLRFSPDNTKLMVCYGKAELWDIATRQRLLTVPGISGDFSPDGKRFATGGGDPEVANEIRVWETSSGRELLHLQGGDSESLASLTYSPDGQYIVAADVSGKVHTWDAHSGDLLDHGPIMEGSDARVADPAPEPRWQIMTNSLGMQFVRIEPGEFFMGSPTTEAQRQDNELRHRVKITRPYYLGRFEVTQDEFALVTGRRPSNFSPAGERKDVVGLDTGDMPVERVTWNDAVDFCRRLSALPEERAAGRAYRLPTEVQWEYACRAGTTTAFNVGDTLSPAQANFDATRPYGDVDPGISLKRTRTVGTYPPNDWGLYDMHGNVWEWCLDGQRMYRPGTVIDPVGPTPDDKRSLRGSGFFLAGFEGRSGRRQTESVTWQAPNLGFRVVCEIKK